MKGAGIRADLRFSRFQRAALKSEARNPKSEGNPKSEIRRAWWRLDLFGFRVSDFGFRQILTDFRSPLPFVLHELALSGAPCLPPKEREKYPPRYDPLWRWDIPSGGPGTLSFGERVG